MRVWVREIALTSHAVLEWPCHWRGGPAAAGSPPSSNKSNVLKRANPYVFQSPQKGPGGEAVRLSSVELLSPYIANLASATFAADVRFSTQSFEKTLSECLQTVRSFIPRIFPISPLRLPCYIHSNTSDSRRVRPKDSSGCADSLVGSSLRTRR